MTSYFERFEPRRCAIYRTAAPLFAEHGYRGTTVRMLAKSCRLSTSGLYHHFRSKRELALFPILAREPLVIRCQAVLHSDVSDPLQRLRVFIDEGLKGQSEFLLAIRLAEESGSRTLVEPVLRSIFRRAARMYASFLREAAEGISRERATEFGEAALAIVLGADAPGHRMSVATVRAVLYALVEAYVVPAGVRRERFAVTFAAESMPAS